MSLLFASRKHGQEWIIPTTVGLYNLGFALNGASARVVEQVLIHRLCHFFFASRKHGQEWIRTTEGVSQRIYSLTFYSVIDDRGHFVDTFCHEESESRRSAIRYWDHSQ